MSRIHVERHSTGGAPLFSLASVWELFRGGSRSTGSAISSPRPGLTRGHGSFLSTLRHKPVGEEDFRQIKRIGVGEFSEVFLVRKLTGQDQGELYAMKITKAPQYFSRDEARSMTLGASPLVTACHYTFGTTIVMEYASRGSVEDALAKRTNRRLKPNVVLAASAELATAIGHLHAVGVVHRDLKPANLLIDARGHVLIADFGFSGVCDTRQRAPLGRFCGTVAYCAPEILVKGARYGCAVDWWSLGCVLCELMIGKTPFWASTPRALFQNILHNEPKWHRIQDKPIDASTELAQAFRTLLEGLLRKDPDQRFCLSDLHKGAVFKGTDWKAVARREKPPFHEPPVVVVLTSPPLRKKRVVPKKRSSPSSKAVIPAPPPPAPPPRRRRRTREGAPLMNPAVTSPYAASTPRKVRKSNSPIFSKFSEEVSGEVENEDPLDAAMQGRIPISNVKGEPFIRHTTPRRRKAVDMTDGPSFFSQEEALLPPPPPPPTPDAPTYNSYSASSTSYRSTHYNEEPGFVGRNLRALKLKRLASAKRNNAHSRQAADATAHSRQAADATASLSAHSRQAANATASLSAHSRQAADATASLSHSRQAADATASLSAKRQAADGTASPSSVAFLVQVPKVTPDNSKVPSIDAPIAIVEVSGPPSRNL